jgi:hypothetical protein
VAIRGLTIKLGKGEWPRVRKQRVEVVNGVENSDHVAKSCSETDNVLCENSLGNIDSRARDFFCEVGDAVTLRIGQ